jgi:hypothetical protein
MTTIWNFEVTSSKFNTGRIPILVNEGRCLGDGKSNKTSPDAGSSNSSSDLKYRANDARDGSWLCSNRRDQSGLNACCTVTWKANRKTTTLLLFLDSLYQKQRQMWDVSSGDKKYKLKEEALDRTLWRTRFGRGYGPVIRQTTEWWWSHKPNTENF